MKDISSWAYSSPSQNREQFQSFCDFFDILVTNINNLNLKIWIITVDLHGNCSKWYFSDTNDNIGKKLDIIKLTAGFTQLLKKLPIIKTIHLPELTLFLHVILA